MPTRNSSAPSTPFMTAGISGPKAPQTNCQSTAAHSSRRYREHRKARSVVAEARLGPACALAWSGTSERNGVPPHTNGKDSDFHNAQKSRRVTLRRPRPTGSLGARMTGIASVQVATYLVLLGTQRPPNRQARAPQLLPQHQQPGTLCNSKSDIARGCTRYRSPTQIWSVLSL